MVDEVFCLFEFGFIGILVVFFTFLRRLVFGF